MATILSFRAALYDTDTYPGTYPTNQVGGASPALQGGNGSQTYGQPGCDATSVHRLLSKLEGNLETQFVVTTLTSLTRDYYVSKFITEPLKNITSITAQQWTSHCAIAESSLSAQFIGPFFTIYVWRPSGGGSVVGFIYTWAACGGFGEPVGASTTVQTLKAGNLSTGVGSAVTGVQDGDVIICELWFRQASTVEATDRFWYDGNLEYSFDQNGASGTNIDINSYISTPQDLTFEYEFPDSIEMDVTDSKTIANKFITIAT